MKWQKPDLTPNSIGRSSSHDGLDSGVPDNCVGREYCYSQNIQIIAIHMLCLDHIQTEVIPPGQLRIFIECGTANYGYYKLYSIKMKMM